MWWTPLVLQYLMLAMLLMQIGLLVSINCKVETCTEFKAKILKRLSLGALFQIRIDFVYRVWQIV